MPEELGSIGETVALSQGEALDSAEALFRKLGYEVTQRADAFVTAVRRERGGVPGDPLPTLTVTAVPQPAGGVRIELRGDDRDGVQDHQAEWSRWAEDLPKLGQQQGSPGTPGAREQGPPAEEEPPESGSAHPDGSRGDESRASDARQPGTQVGGAGSVEERRGSSGEAGGWVSGGAWGQRPRIAPGKREGDAAPSRGGPTDADPGPDEPERGRDAARATPAGGAGAESSPGASGGGVPEAEASEPPSRRCPNCGAAAERDDAFCTSCGARLTLGPEGFETRAQHPAREAGRPGEGLLRKSREVYERGSARYREWSETRAAERRRAEAARLLAAARGEFERVHAGSSRFLEWWDEYEDEWTEGERLPATAPLAAARDRAREGLERIAQVEGELTSLAQDDSDAFAERANAALDDLEAGRAAALGSLEEFGRVLGGVGGWEKYKEEFAAFAQGLGLKSPPRSAIPAVERFPDPHRRRTYEHKMVQIKPTIAVHGSAHSGDDAARYLQDVVDQHTADGWEFYRVDTLSVAVPPGCLAAFFGAAPAHDQYYVVTFRRPL